MTMSRIRRSGCRATNVIGGSRLLAALMTLFVALTVFSLPSQAQTPAVKKRVAVLVFEDRADPSGSGYAGAIRPGEGVADMLTTALVNSNRYQVLERQELDAVMQEQNLGRDGVVAPETAAQIGRILGVELAVMGAITEFGFKKGEVGGTKGTLGLGLQNQAAVVAIDVRLVDTSSGAVLAAEGVRRTQNKVGLRVETEEYSFANSSEFDQSIVGKATREAIEDIVKIIDAQSSKIRWTARVVTNAAGNIVINAGERGGVQIGDRFAVYRPGEVLIDPDTGINLGSLESELGIIEVTDNTVGDGRASSCRVVTGAGMDRGDVVRLPA